MAGIDPRVAGRRPVPGRRAPDPWQLPPAGMSSGDVTLRVGAGPAWAPTGWARRHRTELAVLAALAVTVVLIAWITAVYLAFSAGSTDAPGPPAGVVTVAP